MANKTRVKAVNIDSGTGPQEPSDANIANGKYGLARPLYIYVSVASANKPEVASFVTFSLSHVKEIAHQTGYLPLQDAAYKSANERFAKRVTGIATASSKK